MKRKYSDDKIGSHNTDTDREEKRKKYNDSEEKDTDKSDIEESSTDSEEKNTDNEENSIEYEEIDIDNEESSTDYVPLSSKDWSVEGEKMSPEALRDHAYQYQMERELCKDTDQAKKLEKKE